MTPTQRWSGTADRAVRWIALTMLLTAACSSSSGGDETCPAGTIRSGDECIGDAIEPVDGPTDDAADAVLDDAGPDATTAPDVVAETTEPDADVAPDITATDIADVAPDQDVVSTDVTDIEPDVTPLALPIAVDDYYAPAGHMGDGSSNGITADNTCADPRPGEAAGLCHTMTWTPGAAGWAGVYWQYPEGNWGSSPGLLVAQGATEVTFYAWGESGDEVVRFMVGMSDVDGFEATTGKVTLATTPTAYSIDLTGVTYTDVVGGFGWVADERVTPLTLHLDDIQWR